MDSCASVRMQSRTRAVERSYKGLVGSVKRDRFFTQGLMYSRQLSWCSMEFRIAFMAAETSEMKSRVS